MEDTSTNERKQQTTYAKHMKLGTTTHITHNKEAQLNEKFMHDPQQHTSNNTAQHKTTTTCYTHAGHTSHQQANTNKQTSTSKHQQANINKQTSISKHHKASCSRCNLYSSLMMSLQFINVLDT